MPSSCRGQRSAALAATAAAWLSVSWGVREGAGVSDGGDTRQRVEMNRSALFVPGGAAAV